MRRTLVILAAALALAGCGGETAQSPAEVQARAAGAVGQVQRVFGGLGTRTSVSAPRAVPGGFTPQAIAAEPGAYRLVQINALGLAEPARLLQENGDETTLALQSGPTAAFDGGVLVATRGFGDDLLTMESGDVRAALRAGGGQVTRRMEALDGQDQVLTDSFACTITPAGRETVDLGLRQADLARFDENCRGTAIIFDNIYWLDDAGQIVSSRQYVSPTVAYLRSSRL
ncbi:YjbF family lipoprotein [Rubellimicrobium roseum]|nr:YjbF family lipoprotein [Rubellimicrobium roseum]